MIGIYAVAMSQMADELDACDVRVTIDPVGVNPPCAVVDPPTIVRLSMGHYNIQHTIHLVAPGGTGTRDALAILDDMLERVINAIDPDSIQPSTYTLGSTGDGAPALTITLERSV